ncbi:MAG: hypothetical protein ACFFC1_07130, partial [Promethearchaeota archaeon]
RHDYITRLEFQLSTITQLDGTKIEVMTDWPAVCKELLDQGSINPDTIFVIVKSIIEKIKD